jgi:hypothetical protein
LPAPSSGRSAQLRRHRSRSPAAPTSRLEHGSCGFGQAVCVVSALLARAEPLLLFCAQSDNRISRFAGPFGKGRAGAHALSTKTRGRRESGERSDRRRRDGSGRRWRVERRARWEQRLDDRADCSDRHEHRHEADKEPGADAVSRHGAPPLRFKEPSGSAHKHVHEPHIGRRRTPRESAACAWMQQRGPADGEALELWSGLAVGAAGCRGRVGAGDAVATAYGALPPGLNPMISGVCAGPVPLLAALVVFDHPPSAFIFDEGVRVVKDRNGTRDVVVGRTGLRVGIRDGWGVAGVGSGGWRRDGSMRRLKKMM